MYAAQAIPLIDTARAVNSLADWTGPAARRAGTQSESQEHFPGAS